MAHHVRRAVGLFSNRQDAERALTELRDANFPLEHVSAIAQDPRTYDRSGGTFIKSAEEQTRNGAAAGATTGAAAGGIVGLAGGLGLLAIPGIGLAAEAGILLGSTLLGSGVGAAGGGLVGALLGWGLPEVDALFYDERIVQGDYLIVVEGTPNLVQQAEAVLSKRNIQEWRAYDATSSKEGTLRDRQGVL